MTSTSSQPTKRLLTLEDESFVIKGSVMIETFGLECDVCKDIFDMQAKIPKLMPCNHTICRACLEKIIGPRRTASMNTFHSDSEVSCPICKNTFWTKDASSLPSDHRAVKGLDIIREAKATFKDVCFKHDFQKLDRFCETCEVPVCSDCIRLSHTTPDSDDSQAICIVPTTPGVLAYHDGRKENHTIIKLKNALENMGTHLDDLERQCTSSLRQVKNKNKVIRNIKQQLEKNKTDQIKKVEDSFNHFSNLLEQRKQALINTVLNREKKYLLEINLEIQKLEKSSDELQKLYNDFTSSRESRDVRQLFKLRKHIMANDLLNVSNYDHLCQTVEFQSIDGEEFKSYLATTGTLQTKRDLTLQCLESGS